MSDNNAEAEIKAIEANFVENANAKDPAKLVREFYAEDAILIPPGSPANVVGTKALTDFWHQMIFDDKAVDVTMDTKSVDASGDLAYEIGEFGYSAPDKQGVQTRTTGKYVVIFKKEKSGGYKATVDIFNVNE